MRKLRLLLLALLTCSLIILPPRLAHSQVCPDQGTFGICELGLHIFARHSFYRVEGATAPQLVAQIRDRGPLWSDGNRYEAMHTWKLNRTFGLSQIGDRCVLSTPSIAVETEITMPHWEPPTTASPQLITNWNHYTKALEQHEDGHRRISLEAGEQVLQRLQTLPSYTNCADLRAAAKTAVAEVLEHTNYQQREYDDKTQHGLVQGASYSRWLNEHS